MLHACRSQKNSALHLAVQANNLDIVKILISEGININAKNSSHITPLLLCCQYNSHDIIHYLLQK